MLTLPSAIAETIVPFAELFSERVVEHAKTLLVGAILAPGKRTVTAALRILGKAADPHFQTYHRVLNRARWSARRAGRTLLRMLVDTFVADGPVVLGVDDTIERRRGAKIAARGIYRDPVRSSHSHFVKASGLRWLSLMLLARVAWAERVWALPFLTILTPSERYYDERGFEHKPVLTWTRQALWLVKRWLPNREVIVLGDSSFSAIDLLAAVRHQVCVITRLRLDAALYEPAPARRPGQNGRPRKKGAKLPTLQAVLNDPTTRWQSVTVREWYGEGEREVEVTSATAVWYHSGKPVVPLRWVLIRDPEGHFKPQALLATRLELTPTQILGFFVQRWSMETTFEEARAHLGLETQRQWSDLAIARTTPVLLALYSMVTLMANHLIAGGDVPVRGAAWYSKAHPTFSDTIALVRRCLWSDCHFSTSGSQPDLVKIPRSLLERFTDALCYAA
jgi:hypothetical protein